MAQKNEAPILALAFLLTLGLIGGGLWVFKEPIRRLFDHSLSSTPATSSTNGALNPAQAPLSTNSAAADYSAFAQAQGIPSGLFNYGGSTTWAPIRGEVDPVIQTVWPMFKLRYTDPVSGAPGSGSGIRMVLENQLAFAQSSRAIKPEEYQAAQQRGFSLKEIPVAIDGIAIAVNLNLNFPGLTVAQLKDIYTGKITDWKQVGGPALPIIPYSRRPEAGGTVEFFVANVLAEEPFGSAVKFIATTTEALRQVAANPGGLYYASAPEVVPQCTVKPLPIGRTADQLVAPYQPPLVQPNACPAQRNQLNTTVFQQGDYPITRRLFVIVKQNNQTDQQAGE
ncbi:MAG: PstS family phosphate ABC transporter substrate-binding protein, partial [Pseudanabaenales cyanobacterium]|nr:PstS family phosphate ABC transporter substrate-binding protein [Pseudanabaenales cyanobacterium]